MLHPPEGWGGGESPDIMALKGRPQNSMRPQGRPPWAALWQGGQPRRTLCPDSPPPPRRSWSTRPAAATLQSLTFDYRHICKSKAGPEEKVTPNQTSDMLAADSLVRSLL